MHSRHSENPLYPTPDLPDRRKHTPDYYVGDKVRFQRYLMELWGVEHGKPEDAQVWILKYSSLIREMVKDEVIQDLISDMEYKLEPERFFMSLKVRLLEIRKFLDQEQPKNAEALIKVDEELKFVSEAEEKIRDSKRLVLH